MRWKRILCLFLSAVLLLVAATPLAGAMGQNPDEDPDGEHAQIAAQEPEQGPDFGPRITEESTQTRRAAVAAPADSFTLGNASDMMLAGGGRMVQTDEGLYFLGAVDGCIYRTDGETTESVLDEPARCLNWLDGSLYCAVCGDDGFSVLRIETATGKMTALLESFPGELKQLYAASSGALYFLADTTIYRMEEGLEPEALRQEDGIVSFVPTHYGLVWASGEVFCYDVSLEDTLLAEDVEDYYVLEDPGDRRLVYTVDGASYEISLGSLAAGSYTVEPFSGITGAASAALETEELPPEETPDTVEPISAAKRSVETESVQTRAVSQGAVNIALRAYQMTDIKWKCVKNVYGWKSNVLYVAGLTYTGLPYGQPIDKCYVPWNTTYNEFLSLTADENSAFYHDRSGVTDGLAYATDCSAFVAWAWQTSTRMNTVMPAQSDVSTVVGANYTAAQIGDCINNIGSHVVLVTNIKYNTAGEISAIEIAAANVNASLNFCCAREWYGAGYAKSLADLQSRFFSQGYQLYRCNKRDSVTFTAEPNIPVSHDADTGSGGSSETYKPVVHYGMDVSQWQGTIDWSQARKYIEFAIIRSSHSITTMDSEFERNVAACIKYKIPYGIYIYAKATTVEEAVAEAKSVISRLNGRKPDLPVYYDVEDNDSNLALTNEELYDVVSAFCETIEKAGLKAGVYSFTSAFNEHLTDSRLSKWACWVAQINDSYTCTYKGGFQTWQYSWKGRIPGITDPRTGNLCDVDLDVWVGDIGDLSHRYTMTRTAATCTKSGKVVYSSTDGKVKLTVSVQSLGHTFENGRCTRCGTVNTAVVNAAAFSDVDPNAWYFSAVNYALKNGLFYGVSNTEFDPDGYMTRAMLVTVLWRIAGKPIVVAYNPFRDVLPGAWYYDAVTWAYHKGVVSGTSSTAFSPNDQITREQIATIIYRYSGQKQSSTAVLNSYVDGGQVSSFAKYGMAWAVDRGIVAGVSSTELDPLGNASRAQGAAMLQRYAVRYG